MILSIPVWGVESKNEVTAPFEAPCFFNEAETGITEHEQSGSGTPNRAALIIENNPLLFPKFFSINSCDIITDKNPANKKPNNK